MPAGTGAATTASVTATATGTSSTATKTATLATSTKTTTSAAATATGSVVQKFGQVCFLFGVCFFVSLIAGVMV